MEEPLPGAAKGPGSLVIYNHPGDPNDTKLCRLGLPRARSNRGQLGFPDALVPFAYQNQQSGVELPWTSEGKLGPLLECSGDVGSRPIIGGYWAEYRSHMGSKVDLLSQLSIQVGLSSWNGCLRALPGSKPRLLDKSQGPPDFREGPRVVLARGPDERP